MDRIFKWKTELIKRDPLFDALTEAFHKIIDARSNSNEFLIKFKMGDPVLEEIKRYYATPDCPENIRNDHKKKYPTHWNLFQLEGEIGYKWHVHLNCEVSNKEILIDPYTNDEVIWVGSPPTIKGHEGIIISDFEKYPQLNWTPYPNKFNKEPILADINEFVTPGYKYRGKWISIIVDVSRLKKDKSAKLVKQTLAKIIDENISKNANKIPHDEYPECAFLYSHRDEHTFRNYLRWYDIHTKEKLSFRLIAHIEKIRKTNPQRASEILNELRHKKIKWGNPIQGEDNIEKQIKTIYKAIHRKNYSKKDVAPIIEEYNCPQHGNDCPQSCKHMKTWYQRFKRLAD